MKLTSSTDKLLFRQWVIATSVGLGIGLFLNFLVLPQLIGNIRVALLHNRGYFTGFVQLAMHYLYPWTYLVVGITVGILNGLVLRKHIGGFLPWFLATAAGWTLALTLGVKVFDATFEAVAQVLKPFPSATVCILYAELLSGLVFGLIIGLAQWFVLRNKLESFKRWIWINILAWTVGLVVEGFLILAYGIYVHQSPFLFGFETIDHQKFGVLTAIRSSSFVFSAIDYFGGSIAISMVIGILVGAIIGIELFPKALTVPDPPFVYWRQQNLSVKIFSGAGIALTILSIGLSLFLAIREFDALTLSTASLEGDQGGPAPESCTAMGLELKAERTIKESQSIPLYVKIANPYLVECEPTVNVYIIDFDFVPVETSKTVSIPPKQEASLLWIITPKRLGTYSIGASIGAADQTSRTPDTAIGISVINIFGLTAPQAKLLSSIGVFLGPALTFPWLYATWQQKHEKEQKQAAEEKIKDLERQVRSLKRKVK